METELNLEYTPAAESQMDVGDALPIWVGTKSDRGRGDAPVANRKSKGHEMWLSHSDGHL